MSASSKESDFGRDLPPHLRRYVVEQDYSRYTPVDQAVWRHIMRQLKSFLSAHAHHCYVEGLAKTGIEIDRIPAIEHMSERLQKFGWRAVPVSGFIPPAAFMELQSLGVLPIASDMRTVDHLLYTPAPDIVHEAAGHAPILVDPAFAAYLKSYASVARKAILSREDMDQYEAIRILSDIKEDPGSTPQQIKQAEDSLEAVTKAMKDTSEGALLGRMNWWTAEYGLIGDLENPKIFGAGLLSSVGEARACLSAKVKKLPLTLDCINFSYDITEQQPQLFVVEKFENLEAVLQQLADKMAFRRGGLESAEKARRAETVNTVELDSGLQISGVLKSIVADDSDVSYLRFEGSTQLAENGTELAGNGVDYHRQGFGTPVGRATIATSYGTSSELDLTSLTKSDLDRRGVKVGTDITLTYTSGIVVTGKVKSLHFGNGKSPGRLQILTLDKAKAVRGHELFFSPEWGIFDIAIGSKVASVFGGPADRSRYGETEDFTRKLIPRKTYGDVTLKKHDLYRDVRKLREDIAAGKDVSEKVISQNFSSLVSRALSLSPDDWLIQSELVEIADMARSTASNSNETGKLKSSLERIAKNDSELASHIQDAQMARHGGSESARQSST